MHGQQDSGPVGQVGIDVPSESGDQRKKAYWIQRCSPLITSRQACQLRKQIHEVVDTRHAEHISRPPNPSNRLIPPRLPTPLLNHQPKSQHAEAQRQWTLRNRLSRTPTSTSSTTRTRLSFDSSSRTNSRDPRSSRVSKPLSSWTGRGDACAERLQAGTISTQK